MRKSIFLTLVLSLCLADFGAFAATARNSRSGGTNANADSTATTSGANTARAARGVKRVAGTTGLTTLSGGTGTAKKTVVTSPVAPSGGGTGAGKQPSLNAGGLKKVQKGRAATTKKALSMGTKVATATENTAVDSECQNAYYGCMDAFCMLDNAAGGRCQCSDRVTELDDVLNEIMKLDEQSMRIATEGVEKVQMGEYADQISAKARAIEEGIDSPTSTTSAKKGTTPTTKYTSSLVSSSSSKKVIDLSAWSNSSMFDDDEEESDSIFAEKNSNKITNEVIEDIASRKGDDLQKAAASACVKQLPESCQGSSALLQMAYVQRVRSDCVGYENALKQQRTASQQKLLTAQKAVREAVLDDVRNKNKFETVGECVAEFNKCMQTTGGCGSDYLNCVADDTVLTMGTDGKKGKSTTYIIPTSVSSIGVSENTYAMLQDRRPVCEVVLKQCENVRDGVWDKYIAMIAPTLKAAEVNAEQNRRMDCVGNIVNCFSKACASKWPNQESTEYDMCLANPSIVQNLCEIQINKCSTGKTGDLVMEYVTAKLKAMRVDACTNQVKQCLLSEDACGPDYAACVGFDSDTILDFCPADKLLVCMGKKDENGKAYDASTVREYVAKVAQGLALNIDNKFQTICQNAAKKATEAVCGSEDSCDNIAHSVKFIDRDFKVQFCKKDGEKYNCKELLSNLSDDEVISGEWGVKIVDALDPNDLIYNLGYSDSVKHINDTYNEKADKAATSKLKADALEEKANELAKLEMFIVPSTLTDATAKKELTEIAKNMTKEFNKHYSKIKKDPTVVYCSEGREIQGFSETASATEIKKIKTEDDKVRFPNLVSDTQELIADQILSDLYDDYDEKMNAAKEELKTKNEALTERISKIEAAKEAALDAANSKVCTSSTYVWSPRFIHARIHTNESSSVYDPETNICTQTIKFYTCPNIRAAGNRCRHWGSHPVEKEEVRTIQLSIDPSAYKPGQ